MTLTILVLMEMAIVKAERALVMETLIDLVVQVGNFPVALKTVTMDAAFRVSNIVFPIGLTTTQLNNATPTLDLIAFQIEY
jgi:hypothetical protein